MQSKHRTTHLSKRVLCLMLMAVMLLGLMTTGLAAPVPDPMPSDEDSTYLLFMSDVHATDSWSTMYYGDGLGLVDSILAEVGAYPIDNVTFIGDTVAAYVNDELAYMQAPIQQHVTAALSPTLDALTADRDKDATYYYAAPEDAQADEDEYERVSDLNEEIQERNDALADGAEPEPYEVFEKTHLTPVSDDGLLFVNGMTHEDGVSYTNKAGAYEYDKYIIYVIGCDAYTKDGAGDYTLEVEQKDDNGETMLDEDGDPVMVPAEFSYVEDGPLVVAGDLAAYLEGLKTSGDTRPVIVASHFPLYSKRDGLPNSIPVAETLNAYAADLDILFLCGHNHTNDNDKEYFFPAGTVVGIPDGEEDTVDMEIRFNMMTAGYVNTNRNWSAPNGNYLLMEVTDDFLYLHKGTVGENPAVRLNDNNNESTGYLFTGDYTVRRNGAAAYGISYQDYQLNGTVAVDRLSALPGETITVSTTPLDGFALSTVNYVVDGVAHAALVTGNEATFLMPEGNVSAVRAGFTPVGSGVVYREVNQLEAAGVYIVLGGLDSGSGIGYAATLPKVLRSLSELGETALTVKDGAGYVDVEGSALDGYSVIDTVDADFTFQYNQTLTNARDITNGLYLGSMIFMQDATVSTESCPLSYDPLTQILSTKDSATTYYLTFDPSVGFAAST